MSTIAQPPVPFSELLEQRPPAGPEWLEALRRRARDRFAAEGLPTRKDEAWRYTSLDPLLAQVFYPAASTEKDLRALRDLLPERTDNYRLVLLDGRFSPALSYLPAPPAQASGLATALGHPDSHRLESLGTLSGNAAHPFRDLNTALFEDGALIRIPAGVRLDRPLELLHVSSGRGESQIYQPRHLVLIEPEAELVLLERHIALTQGLYLNNLVSEIRLGEGASLVHERLQEEAGNAFHLAALHLHMRADSRYRCVTAALGAAWSRTEFHVAFAAPGAESEIHGLYLAGDQQLVDHHVDVVHAVPGCSSQELFKGILDGRGRAVFDGRVLVERNAQKTAAHLANANLMLSRNAEVDTKPQLEIYADDVQCSHGTSVGQLEPEALFYLRSRGIGETEARKLLCLGFAGEILEAYSEPALRERAEGLIRARLDGSPSESMEH